MLIVSNDRLYLVVARQQGLSFSGLTDGNDAIRLVQYVQLPLRRLA